MEEQRAKLKIYSTIYCILLTLFAILLLIAKFLVGTAGHASNFTIQDLIVYSYIAVSISSLIANLKKNKKSSQLKYLNIVLVGISFCTATYILFEMLVSKESLFLPIISLALFIGICFLLIRALYKG